MAINDQLERIITALDYLNKTKTTGYPLSIEDRVYTISNQLQQLVDSGFGELPIHVCTAEEYDPETGIPTVENPEENTFYLVPNVDPEDPNMFMEYIYTGDHWELFGSGGQGVAGVGIASVVKTGTSGKIDTYTITYTDGTTTTYQIVNGADGANVTIEETLVSGEDYSLDFEETGVSPVESVAGKTGVVVLDGGDVGYNDAATYANGTVGAEVSELKTQINGTSGTLTTTRVNGLNHKNNTTAYESESSYATCYFPVKAGYKYKIFCEGIVETDGKVCRLSIGANVPANGVSADYINALQAVEGECYAFTAAIDGYAGVSYYYYSASDITTIYATYSNVSIEDRLDNLDDSAADTALLMEAVGVEKDYSDYYTVNYGNSNTDVTYEQYKDINKDTGAFVSSTYSTRYASSQYFPIPYYATIFHYMDNQSFTAASSLFYFYDVDKVYLGKSTMVTVGPSNSQDDTVDGKLGKLVTIPTGAKYFRVATLEVTNHINVKGKDYIVDEVQIPKLSGYTNSDDFNALEERVSDLEDTIDNFEDIQEEVIVTKTITPYAPVDDCGDTQTEYVYNSGYKLDAYTGEYLAESGQPGWATCQTYFEIPDGAKIFNYMHNQSVTSISVNYCFYASDKSYLGRSTFYTVTTKTDTWNGYNGAYVPIPDDAKYFRIWAGTTSFHCLVLVQGLQTDVDIQNLISAPRLLSEYNNIKYLTGKSILALGDSIWGNDRTNGISDFLAEYSGATVYNGAVGGTRITGDRGQYLAPAYKPFDGVNLIHALITQTWTEQDAEVDNVTAYVKTETLPMLKQLDMSTIDVIVLAYGHNDFTAPKSISAIQSAFNAAVSEILTAYPSIRILIIAPPWRMFSNGTVDGDVYENENNDTLRDISDSIIDAANNMHITSINMLNELPWRAETKSYYFDSDFTHPNTNGNRIYAHAVYGKLRSMY